MQKKKSTFPANEQQNCIWRDRAKKISEGEKGKGND